MLRRAWLWLPVVVRATVLAFVLLVIGQLPPSLALVANLKWQPRWPWFPLVTAAWLWFFWSYLNGRWPPRGTSESRRQDLRAAALPGEVWRCALLAGGLGMIGVLSLALFTGRVAALPAEAYEAPFDLSTLPWWTVLAFFLSLAATAAVVEEAAFRGYMLSQIQRHHGWVLAIALTSALFYLVHRSHAYATLAFVPFFAAYSLLHAALVYLTRSILPSVVLHAAGDFCILPVQYGVIPLPFGPTWPPYLLSTLAFSVAAIAAFRRLRSS